MTDARTKQIQEIEVLLAERRKYEQWLTQLEARKESTPSHVFVKVHQDYAGRLADAQKRLLSESGAVHALAGELDQSLAAQERQIAERTDERSEAELRAAVGEFAGKEWDKLRGKLDSAIADLSGERDNIQRELDTLRTLLAEAEAAPVAGETRDIDDIAFLRSVLGRSTPYSNTPAPDPSDAIAASPMAPPVAAPMAPRVSAEIVAPVIESPPVAAAPPPAPAPAPAPGPAPREPAYERAGPTLEAPRASSSARASSAAPRPSVPELFATPEIPEDPSGPRGSDDRTPHRPSAEFGRLTPRTSEAVKSLKCQECGTLNFPTEWYCERCGGELAAF